MKKKDTKLYNMIFPPYLLVALGAVPWLSALVIFGNLAIDSIVLLIITLILFKRMNWKFFLKRVFVVWIIGFLGDIAGIIFLLIGSHIGYPYIVSHSESDDIMYKMMDGMNNVTNHPGDLNIYSYILLWLGILVAAAGIFFFDYYFVFRREWIPKKKSIIAALTIAVLTAPYTFLIPNSFFY